MSSSENVKLSMIGLPVMATISDFSNLLTSLHTVFSGSQSIQIHIIERMTFQKKAENQEPLVNQTNN